MWENAHKTHENELLWEEEILGKIKISKRGPHAQDNNELQDKACNQVDVGPYA